MTESDRTFSMSTSFTSHERPKGSRELDFVLEDLKAVLAVEHGRSAKNMALRGSTPRRIKSECLGVTFP